MIFKTRPIHLAHWARAARFVLSLAVLPLAILPLTGCMKAPLKMTLEDNPDILIDAFRKNPGILREAMLADANGFLAAVEQAKVEAVRQARRGEMLKQARTPVLPVLEAGRAIRGDADAPMTIVAYQDFTDPDALKGADAIKTLLEKYPGKLRAVVKHNVGPGRTYARQAALAFEAAARDNPAAAFQLHDLMIYNHGAVAEQGEKEIRRLARSADVNMAGLDRRLRSPGELDERIRRDAAEAASFGLGETPGYVVGGVVLPGPAGVADFEDVFRLIEANRPTPLPDVRPATDVAGTERELEK